MALGSQPTGSQKKQKKPIRPKSNLVKLESSASLASSSLKRFDPLTAFKTYSTQDDGELAPQITWKGKEKEKSREEPQRAEYNPQDYRLWVDIYEPMSEAEIAVHNKKFEDVRHWLNEAFSGGPSGKLTRYRRILALTGPAGTAKTTTVRVLSRQMGFKILEWRNAMSEGHSNLFNDLPTSSDDTRRNYDPDQEALFDKFETFINRASNCQSIFTETDNSASGSQSQSQDRSKSTSTRQIILLEDLPNIVHPETRIRFHAVLQSLVKSPPSSSPVPIVVIVSNAGMRGEASDERMANGGGWGRDKEGVVDIRTVLSRELLGGPYVTLISFNPISRTLLTKALQALLNKHFSSSMQAPPSRDVLDIIVDSSNGDIRSAVMALQFACTIEMDKGQKKKNRKNGSSIVLESVTRREQSLVLFHLMGRVLYNKRKGDPPSSSASAKDIKREKVIDAQLKDPPKLPYYLKEHERRASRVDVDMLYADSPIDSSLFSLYIHQNYTQFCDVVEECSGVADWLSWVDSSGGESWYQANPHRFHLLTLGTLHSLPSPVPRRSQKIFKPAFFDCLQKEKNAWDGVRDVRAWVLGEGTSREGPAGSISGWSCAEIAMELGGVLKARDAAGATTPRPPKTHRLFSSLSFVFGKSFGDTEQVDDDEVDTTDIHDEPVHYEVSLADRESQDDGGGWLDSDDIEDF